MITMMITKDDDKGDGKKLKDQSKNNSSESRTSQEFKIESSQEFKIESRRIQDSRRKLRVKNQDQDSRLKSQESRSRFKNQQSRIKIRLNQDKNEKVFFKN